MALNPFKDSNLNDLQKNISDFFEDHFGNLRDRSREIWARFLKRGKERITIMFIPHSEKRILNFHISIFAFSSVILGLIITVTVTSIMIVNHSSTIKEVSKLKMHGSNSKVQIKKYKEEINRLHNLFQKFKPEITYLYSLTPGNNVDTLWAKGGPSAPVPGEIDEDISSPPIEVLNIQEMEHELKTTKEVIGQIKRFLKARKKIIENTPSLWPVEGHIISQYGERTSPYTFRKEFHHGIDIASFPGAPIRATAPGTVESINWDSALGLTISIKHKYGFLTTYSHCQRISVEKGQKISKSEVIGYVGRTGKATRHLCYYQVRIGTEHVDPLPYLNKITP